MTNGRKPPTTPITLEAVEAPDAPGTYVAALDVQPQREDGTARKKRKRRRGWSGVSLLGVALGGALLLFFDPFGWMNFPLPDSGDNHLVRIEAVDIAAQWRDVDRNDPAAIKKFITSGGALAGEAKAALAALDAGMWEKLQNQTNVEERLRALDQYDLNFPDGARANESRALRDTLQGIIERAEHSLSNQGFGSGLADGVITSETTAAIRKYQVAMRLPVTGQIDEALLAQLLATDLSAGASALRPAAANAAATSAAAPSLLPGKAFRDCYSCPEMIPLPLGRASVGDISGTGDSDELPVHEVTIAYELAVGKFEVTFEEWDACVADGGCSSAPPDAGWGRGTRPVINVTWRDAREYAAWLSRKTGKRYRLLSEAEWEYAARATASSSYSFGDNVAALCAYANHADSGTDYTWRNRTCADGFGKFTAPVGAFSSNAYGLYDMHGNVWEWVEDCWHDSYNGAPTDGAAWIKNCTRPGRILRGGSWSVQPENLRVSYRYRFDEEFRAPFFGFRVARAR